MDKTDGQTAEQTPVEKEDVIEEKTSPAALPLITEELCDDTPKIKTLFVESEHKLHETSDSISVTSQPDRPLSAGRERTPPHSTQTSPSTKSDVHQVTNTRNLVAFDTDLGATYPDRSDSETDLIIQKLKDTLATPPPNESQDGEGTFATSVPEEDIEDARRRQQRRKMEIEAKMWDQENMAQRLTMSEVIDKKVQEHFNAGVERANQGQFEAAITSFSKALNLQPRDVSCYVERAEAYLQMCDFRSAHLNYKQAYILEPHNPQLFEKLAFISYLEGQCLFDLGLYSEALESFTKASEMKPTAQCYHTRAIACLAALGRHQECLALTTRQLEAETTGNPELYVLRARLHLKFNNLTLCYYDVRDALSLDSEQPEAKKMMKEIHEKAERGKQQAVSLTIQGKLQEALSKITVSVEADPSRPDYHVFRGALFRRLQNFNAAIDDYLLAMDKADHNEQDPIYQGAQRQLLLTYNDFAVYCYHKGFYEESVVLLNKAIKGEKTEKGLYINRGDCFFKLNDLGFALADYQQAMEIDPTCWDIKCRVAVVHNELGITAYQERRYQEAVKRFSLAVEHNNKVGQFYVHRARSNYMMQDVDAARNDIMYSLHLDPNNEEIIPLLSRLFPGRSVKEVLMSNSAEQVRNSILRMMGPTKKLQPLESRQQTIETSKKDDAKDPSKAKSLSESPISDDVFSVSEVSTPGPRKMPTDAEIIREKKNVADDLKNIFRFPQSLRYTGPRVASNIQPQPPSNAEAWIRVESQQSQYEDSLDGKSR
ncbi:tetratricopeptide repeat protein 16-like [Ciona intestinalis]